MNVYLSLSQKNIYILQHAELTRENEQLERIVKKSYISRYVFKRSIKLIIRLHNKLPYQILFRVF